MKLVSIPSEKFADYRLDAIFDCYKWDPQFLDSNTLAKHALIITESEYRELAKLTEELDFETRKAEEFLNNNLEFIKPLKLPKKLSCKLKKMANYDSHKNIRLTRYDFHKTIDDKWVISEVNSDVPGGFAEASLLPKLAIKYLNDNKYFSIDFGEKLATAISEKIKPNGNIMFVHCTSYSDDRQVMQFIGDKMESLGFHALYGAADHLEFINKETFSILDGHKEKIDCILRFTPLEWLKDMKKTNWDGYFNTITPSCNHPIAIFAQTKRFPFVFKVLEEHNLNFNTWKKLLPKTIEVKDLKGKSNYIYKPVWGRVGEKIAIREAISEEEYKKIIKDVRWHKNKYIAQKKFNSKAIKSPEQEEFHVCLGSYAIDSKHAGFYARISKKNLIDSEACDIPVLIERNKNDK